MKHRVSKLVELYEATGRPEKAAEWEKWTPRTATAPAPARPARAATSPPAVPAPATAPPAATPKQ